MTSKTLRILIADGQHFHRLKIERALNQFTERKSWVAAPPV